MLVKIWQLNAQKPVMRAAAFVLNKRCFPRKQQALLSARPADTKTATCHMHVNGAINTIC